jgi:hypothetical protein
MSSTHFALVHYVLATHHCPSSVVASGRSFVSKGGARATWVWLWLGYSFMLPWCFPGHFRCPETSYFEDTNWAFFEAPKIGGD